MLIEICVGLFDNDELEVCICKEVIEEIGYDVGEVCKIFELYMLSGGVMELIYFFIVEYYDSECVSIGGGVEDEEIEVFELLFFWVLEMVCLGEIWDGKIVLLFNYL